MAKRQEMFTNIESAPILYVNSAHVAQTQFDLRIMLGTALEADDEKVVTRVSATVFMTIQHAKAFSQILIKNIEKFEEMNGPIVLPKLSAGSDGDAK